MAGGLRKVRIPTNRQNPGRCVDIKCERSPMSESTRRPSTRRGSAIQRPDLNREMQCCSCVYIRELAGFTKSKQNNKQKPHNFCLTFGRSKTEILPTLLSHTTHTLRQFSCCNKTREKKKRKRKRRNQKKMGALDHLSNMFDCSSGHSKLKKRKQLQVCVCFYY